MSNGRRFRLGALFLAGAGACGGGNISGVLSATEMGDLSNPPAERGDGQSPLRLSCAVPSDAPAPELSSVANFSRRPYLQRAAQTSADILWVGAADPIPSVTISTPDGAVIGEFQAALDPAGSLPVGARQWAVTPSGLNPNTTYCYQIREGGLSSLREGFRTPPAAGTGQPVRFIAFGDSGGGSDQRPLLDQMHTVPFDFIIHTGDIAYAGGTRAAFERNFFGIYADLLQAVPVFPASGNHEYDASDAVPFREVFALPENGGLDGKERWYSFDWGDVHFAVLDTERTGPIQAAWLEQDLTSNLLPWTIVVGHKPPFSSGEHGSDLAFRQHFGPILERHQVPLVLNGHDHNYERTLPQNGVTYVVTGGGGRGVRPMGSSNFTAFGEAVIHLVYVTVTGNDLALHAIDGVGKEFDSLVIRR